MNTKNEVIEFLRQNRKLLTERYHISKIGLFGSFARDEQTANSDIDLIIELDDSATDIHELKNSLKQFLSNSMCRGVDIAREKYLKPYAREQIMRDAVYV